MTDEEVRQFYNSSCVGYCLAIGRELDTIPSWGSLTGEQQLRWIDALASIRAAVSASLGPISSVATLEPLS